MKNKLFIASHLGLGDHILCNGLYREIAKDYDVCVIPIRRSNVRAMSHMLGDLKNVRLVALPNEYAIPMLLSQRLFYENTGFETLNLGDFGENFLTSGKIRFDENFYLQARIPFVLRWSNFSFERDKNREDELFNELGCGTSDYIFLHEDTSRDYTIDRNRIQSQIRVIQPDPTKTEYSFFDYLSVIQGAKEIHCIESSFAALIESVGSTADIYAHRYARPQASGDYGHEFTYKSNWQILK